MTYDSVMASEKPVLDRDSLRPPAQYEAPKIGPWISILLAGVCALALFAGLFVLMLQVGGPLAIAAVLVFGVGGLVALFHYVIWGWWLAGTIRREVEEEERRQDNREP
jgi:hypothetical protein